MYIYIYICTIIYILYYEQKYHIHLITFFLWWFLALPQTNRWMIDRPFHQGFARR